MKHLARLILVTILLGGLAAYAVEMKSKPKLVDHAFEFGEYGENEGIEVLDYQYGDSKMVGTFIDNDDRRNGRIGQGTGVHGGMPVGDFLYVKWKVLSTGKVYEDKVDLRKRLPTNMQDKIVHFEVKGPQLYVYLIEGNNSAHLHAPGAPDCQNRSYKVFKCTTLYPQHWTNF